MSSEQAEPGGQEVRVEVPPELESGVYANFALVHHTGHEVTIDFCQLGISPPEKSGENPAARVVARINVAPTFVMPLLQAISQNLAQRDDSMRKLQEGEGQE